MDVTQLIDKAKIVSGAESDRALAKLLGVSHGVPSQWRTGISIPKPEHAQRLAELAGIDPTATVIEALIHATKDNALKSTLEGLKRRVAALLVLGATLPALAADMAARVCILCKMTARPANFPMISR